MGNEPHLEGKNVKPPTWYKAPLVEEHGSCVIVQDLDTLDNGTEMELSTELVAKQRQVRSFNTGS